MSGRLNSSVGSINRMVTVNHAFRRIVRGNLHVVKRKVRKFIRGGRLIVSSVSGTLHRPASGHVFMVSGTFHTKCAVSRMRRLAGVSG